MGEMDSRDDILEVNDDLEQDLQACFNSMFCSAIILMCLNV